ncbi:hypothetical protein BMS3Abin17_01113 [archaeon BMS3Abin17]|nr:hypothetical protein BMS3Abin17_01113 [archaeon BMS3Abin17]HDZ60115.1 hypothetical protein [Candidatus Pacearchaeota archaeon]
MKIEEFVFNTEIELVNGMKELGIPYQDILYTLKQEKPHFDRAKELGYNVNYRIKVDRNNVWEIVVAYSGHVDILPKEGVINPEHIKEIALAPPNPSRKDLLIAESMGELLKKC